MVYENAVFRQAGVKKKKFSVRAVVVFFLSRQTFVQLAFVFRNAS